MSSGEVHSVPLEVIWVDEKRQRKEFGDIEELAESISRVGLLQHPIVTRDHELKAGQRRMKAVELLGWETIPVHFTDEVDPLILYEIELEENLRRKNLTWQEECEALAEHQEMRKAADPTWTTEDTANKLNLSRSTVAKKIQVAEEMAGGNSIVSGAKEFSKAYTMTKRQNERRKSEELSTIGETQRKETPLQLADFTEWQESYDGPLFNFIHCDFPYGVNADKHAQGASDTLGGYEDSAELYFHLLRVLESGMENVVAEKAHLMFWFSMDYYENTLELLNQMGWRVNPFPLVWLKSDNTGIIPDHMRGPRRVYETAFLASRGDYKIVEPVANAFAAPARTNDRIHMSQKNPEMLEHFFRMFVDENTDMLDPTCGSGSAVQAAKNMNAASVLGLERDEAFYNKAVEAFNV